MKHNFKLLLVALMLLCSTVATAHDFEVGGFFYNITSSTEKTVEVTYKGDVYDAYPNEYTGDVTVPSTVAYNGNTYSVTSIGKEAFYDCFGLTSIEIPGSVTSIGDRAFSGCSGLTSIVVAEENTVYDSRNNCNAIIETATNTLIQGCKNTIISGSVTNIGDYAFYGCSSLTSIEIPGSVTSIGDRAFSGCSGLTSIEIPGSVTSIGMNAFHDCDGLTSVTIGDGVTSIGDYAFYYCDGLASVTSLATTAPALGSAVFYRISSGATLYYPAGSDYSSWEQYFANIEAVQSGSCGDNVRWSLENGVLTISGTGAMWDYSYNNSAPWSSDEITHVIIGDGVTSIGESAFSRCSGLTSVTSLATTAPGLGSGVFTGISSDATLYYPAGSDYSSWAQYFANTEEIAEPIYFGYNNGLPGSMQGNNHVWESGKISFSSATNGIRITVFATNSPDSYNGFPMVALGELEFYNANGEKIDYTAADVTTNSLESSEGSLEGLCDGDYSTFYHSTWRSGTTPSDYVYVDVRFAQPLDAVNIKIVGRNTGRLMPTHIGITSSGVYCPYLGTEGSYGDNVRWSLENGVLTISGTGAMWDYYLDNRAPWPLDEITHVIIEDGVTSIGHGAFRSCSGLTSVTIGDGVTSIGGWAFSGCIGLTSVTIGDGVTSIGDCAFLDCSGLTSIEIPGSVTSIGRSAFGRCSVLTSIEIPGSVTSIGEYAFDWCSRLTSVTIGDGVTSIGDRAFYGCDRLTSIEIPGSVTSIGGYAFFGCSGLTSVTIGDGVTSIGEEAFHNCSGLTSVTIGDGVTSIGEGAFHDCSVLTSIEIPGSVTSIGDWAFSGCSGLTSIEIPGSVTNIGYCAFGYCSGLTSVTIGDGVTSIGECAFYDCSGLTSIEIPGSVTSIGKEAFFGCSGLTSIVVAEENTVYDSRNNCNAIIETATNTLIQGCQNTIIPGSVTSIGEEAFYDCSGLTSIEIPGSVTSIGDWAFGYCSGLTSIEIPGSVTSIGYCAFGYCSGLTSVTSLATTAPALGSYAFNHISSGATLYYPAGSDYSSWAQYFANTEEFEIAEPAVNTIEVTSANMLAGTQALLSFNLKNEDTISGFQFDLHLPNGFSIAKDEMGDEIVYINEERISPRTHSFNTSVNNDGSQLVLVYSQSGAQVRGNEGEVISILVDVAADVAPGNYTVELRDLELVTPEANTYDIPQSAYTLKVCAPCDANGDGTVSVSDIQMIVNMILNDSDPLENPAANANGDGKISVSDIQVVVNRILGKY